MYEQYLLEILLGFSFTSIKRIILKVKEEPFFAPLCTKKTCSENTDINYPSKFKNCSFVRSMI